MGPMEENTPRQARRGVRTGIPLKLSAETLATPKLRISVGVGHIYKDKADGSLWTLTGLRSGRAVILVSATPRGGTRDRLPVDTTLADERRAHVIPHRACMMP